MQTKITLTILILIICATACSPTAPVQLATTHVASTPDIAPTSVVAGPIATLDAVRTATISEINNDVKAQAESDAEFEPAVLGAQINVGGRVRTGDESRARLDTSDGSIVRIASHTEFQVLDFSSQPEDPITKIGLTDGKLWIWVTQLLGNGSLEIETPSGVATVRGSLMSVEYSPATGRMVVTCLEGECRLIATDGQFTDLRANQFSEIPGTGQPPTLPSPMSELQVADWADNFPEVSEVVATITVLPAASATPSPTATASVSDTPDAPSLAVDCQLQSVTATDPASITFVNQSGRTVNVYWLSYDGQEALYRELSSGQSYTQATFVTHPWCVRDANSGEALLAITATDATQTAVIP